MRRCRSERKIQKILGYCQPRFSAAYHYFCFGWAAVGRFLAFGHSDDATSILPAWIQTERVDPPDERLAAAQKDNPDTVAWITIPGTNIDAPVQQYGDNDYYLRRDEKGTEDYHGCIYADYTCRMNSGEKVSRNLIFTGTPLPMKTTREGLRICTNIVCSSLGRRTRTFMFRWQMKN